MNNNRYGKSKIINKVIGMALAVVLIVGVVFVGVLSNGFKDFGNIKSPKQQGEISADNNSSDGGMVLGETQENGIQLMKTSILAADYALYGVSAQAETAYVLTATVTPDNATNKKLDWSVSFANASSAWATGKKATDYVTATPTYDGSISATVQCLAAFGEQIIITATSRDNTAASAKCKVDYAKKVTDCNVTINGGNDLSVAWTQDGNNYTFAVNPVFSVGTIDDTYSYTCKFVARDDFMDAINFVPVIGGTLKFVSKTSYGYSFSSDNMSMVTSYSVLTSRFMHICYRKNDGISDGDDSNVLDNKMYSVSVNTLKNKIAAYSGAMMDMTITATGTYGEFTKTVTINTANNDFSIGTTDVSLNSDSLVY